MFEHVLTLADALKNYYSQDELEKMADYFKAELEYDNRGINHLTLAESLLMKSDLGRNKDFLRAIISSLESRVDEAIANTDWEKRYFHQSMWPRLKPLLETLKIGTTPTEVTVKPSYPFTAKAEVRELLLIATTPLVVVDNYIGLGTLDCLRGTSQPIRLLTGSRTASIEKDFARHLKEFASEGRTIEVRCHPKLHDRYIILNDRCWILGSSLKDAGKKMFSMIEFTDTHEIIIKDVEHKWHEAVPLEP